MNSIQTDIIAAGCTFPSGPTLALASVALRTQLALTRSHPFCVDRCGNPVKTSHFPQTTLNFTNERWQILAYNALQDALRHAPYAATLPSRLWLILPSSDRAGVPAQLENMIAASLKTALPGCNHVTVLRGGHAEGGVAITQIMQPDLHSAHHIDIVLAVDSWQHPDALMWLETEHLLHGSHQIFGRETCINPYGRVPGEGAAVLILAAKSSQHRWCIVEGLATTVETVLHNEQRPCLGLGLTQAARQAIKQAGTTQVTHLVTDMNGEPYRSDEYGFTVSRLNRLLDANFIRMAPVLAAGDLGCASAIALAALSAWHLKLSPTNAREQHLILSSSDDEQRCAMVLGNTTGRISV